MKDRRRVSPRPEYRRLSGLLDEYLQDFSDIAFDSITGEIEKDLLIALSQVLRQVKQLTHEFDSNEEELVEPVDDLECSVSSTPNLNDHYCLAKIIGDLMFLLLINSRYVQHVAGNIVVSISEFLLTLDNGWDDFMHLLCLCLEFAIYNSLISSSSPNEALKTENLDYEPSASRSWLKLKLKNANWFVVAAIFRSLHNIQKYLKRDSDFDHKIVKGYLDSVSSLMLNLPWDILTEIHVGHNTEALIGSANDVALQTTKIVKSNEIIMFFGSCIQFLCSLVAQSNLLDDGVDFTPVIFRIIDLVPKLAAWCRTDLRSPHCVRISRYFRHKVLILMVKLSRTVPIGQSVHVTWIDLVHTYFEDLLMQPIPMVKSDQDDFLVDDSPFYTSIFDPPKENINMSSRHLQRLTVFLLLKCSLSLIRTKESPNEPRYAYENPKHNPAADLSFDSECQSESIGSRKLHEWLQVHVDADIFTDDGLYFDRCVRFSLSFLQLFMHEDDILFEMLLQLFRVPFYPERQIIKDEPLADVKNHPVFLASDLFNPIHVFHLFLAEIHYDHGVLLDYLISKDTGSSCAEYLLRSLRIVCDSWSSFVEFPGAGEGLGQLLCPKRRKLLVRCTDDKEHNEGHPPRGRTGYRIPFAAAKDCMVSLKTSIDSLNKKNLFPYNPRVLLRRLMRFQELSLSSKIVEKYPKR